MTPYWFCGGFLLQPFTSPFLFSLDFPKSYMKDRWVCQDLTTSLSSCLLCGSVWRPQPPAPHWSRQLCESSKQKSGRKLWAVPLTVSSGQCHPGTCQRQQTHPIQVSDSSTLRMRWSKHGARAGVGLWTQWHLGTGVSQRDSLDHMVSSVPETSLCLQVCNAWSPKFNSYKNI